MCPAPTCTLGFVLLVVVVPIRSLIWRAMVRKACSTLLAFLADVSRKGMPMLSANSCSGGVVSGSAKTARDRAATFLPYLGNGVLDHLLVCHIALVAHEQLVDALGGVPVYLLQPLLDVVEGVHVGHIVDHADAVGSPIVRRRDGPEALLAGRVPLWSSQAVSVSTLSIDWGGGGRVGGRVLLTICSLTVFPSSSIVRIFCTAKSQQWSSGPAATGGRAAYKVDTDRGDVRLGVRVIGEPQEQARLSDARVADEEELEQVVVSMACIISTDVTGEHRYLAPRREGAGPEAGALGGQECQQREPKTGHPRKEAGEDAYYSGFILICGGRFDGRRMEATVGSIEQMQRRKVSERMAFG